MFARAFDCYVADKLKATGLRSDYLTADADSFVATFDGNKVAAIPMGEERKLIFDKMDHLIDDLKDRGLLHDYSEKPVITAAEKNDPIPSRKNRDEIDINTPAPNYEQLSLDDLLFSASSRVASKQPGKNHPSKDLSR